MPLESQPEKFYAKLGSTISLPCFADNPSKSFRLWSLKSFYLLDGVPSILWSKLVSEAESRHCFLLLDMSYVCSTISPIAVGEILVYPQVGCSA